MNVPNHLPNHNDKLRLACILPRPAKEDAMVGQPFNDPNNGLFVRTLLRQYGVDPDRCFLGYLCNSMDNSARNPSSDAAQISKATLESQLREFRPNLVLLFGQEGLTASSPTVEKILPFRGSLYRGRAGSPFSQLKCLSTVDPLATMTRSYGNMPLLRFDLKRAITQAKSPSLNLPQRTYHVTPTAPDILRRLSTLPRRIALDIEGGIPNPSATSPANRFPTGITCLSIATSPLDAFIIPLHLFDTSVTITILEKLREVLGDPSIEKVMQNGLYDSFALAWLYHIHIANFCWDTMLSGFELYPELPKSLGVQTSLYTLEPYYKADRLIDNQTTHWEYCCKDSCVTLEIAERHASIMTPGQLAHFQFNMRMIPILLYMELRGIAYDQVASDTTLGKVHAQMSELQTRINTRAGHSVNLNSPKQLNNLLYTELGFPKQHPQKKVGYGIDKTRVTSDIDAILNITQKTDAQILHEILAWRKLEKYRTALGIKSDRDLRVRSSYNPVGTDTNRLSSSKSPTGGGANLQTITKKLRRLYSAGASISTFTDEPRYFFQVDLAGADGWTVAAHCNAYGDPTMLNDYRAGIKPARVIGLMYLEGSEVSKLSREELKTASKVVGEGEHLALYFTCKQVQHGSNYLLGHAKMAKLIVKSSYKQLGQAIRISTTMCKALQDLYFSRYKGAKSWQKRIESDLKTNGSLPCASGHIRTFHGRRNSSDTIRKALAHEPQHNTTYATNLAIQALWSDPENRNPDGSLIIEPHHQVHDAVCGSFPISRASWAEAKLRSYFDNPITIADQQIRIPAEGEYGPSWGESIHYFNA